jgi:TonB family protein
VSKKDFDKLYRHYPSKKSYIKTEALLSIKTINDCQEAYNYFPSKKNDIGIIALKIANSYKELGSIAELFNNIAVDAETKALYNIQTIDDKREFITYFASSTYALNIQKEIDIEEGLDFKLQVVKEKINSLIINTYSDGKQSSQTSSELEYSEGKEMERIIELTYAFDWIVYFSSRPIDYNIDFVSYINLDNGNISFSQIRLLMDDDLQELSEFMNIKPQIESVYRSLIQDFKALNILESKRVVTPDLPNYYRFKFKNNSVLNVNKKDIVNKPAVFEIVENMPEFPGGEGALKKYLVDNIEYPQAAREAGVQGRVFINFIVEKDGEITDVRVLRGIGSGCDKEAVRVIKNMPKWKPGMNKGEMVRVSFNLPVKFSLTN